MEQEENLMSTCTACTCMMQSLLTVVSKSAVPPLASGGSSEPIEIKAMSALLKRCLEMKKTLLQVNNMYPIHLKMST